MKQDFIIILFCCQFSVFAQEKSSIEWISFEQLEDSLQVKSKKTFIYFYADWCVYCKKMEQVAFARKPVIQKLNNEYYAVKMNVESKDSIYFDGRVYTNEQSKK